MTGTDLSPPDGSSPRVSRASITETLGVVGGVLAPIAAQGLIVRRPWAVALSERLALDRRAVERLQELRDRHGSAPLVLRIPGRSAAVILSPGDLRRVLDGAPRPFTPATREKRAALSQFEPHGVLISPAEDRIVRRPFNEAVLQASAPVHAQADAIVAAVRREVDELLGADRHRPVRWDGFTTAWWRIVRTVVLGRAARDDHEVTDLLARLRADANWTYLRPTRRRTRARFLSLVAGHVERAEAGSLAHLVATTPAPPGTAPDQQVPQWLFAFDEAALATLGSLALLAAHPEHQQRARDELDGLDLSSPQELPFLRATVLESLRLWPTTPAVLRDTTEDTTWGTDVLPGGTSLVIHAPFFHRDDRHLDAADRFEPGLWLDGRTGTDWPLIPFSAGPATCPGRNLVLLVTTTVLAAVLERGHVGLLPAWRLDGSKPLPGTLNTFDLAFSVG